MFHLSRALVFIACLAAALYVNQTIGAVGMIACVFIIPNPNRATRRPTPVTRAGGDK